MELNLTAEEKLNFENIELKMQNLQLQMQGLQMQKNETISQFCEVKDKNIEEFEGIDLQKGVAIFKSEEE